MTEFIIRAITGKPVVSIPNIGEIVTELKRPEIKKLYAYILSAIGGEECRFLNAHRVRRLPKR